MTRSARIFESCAMTSSVIPPANSSVSLPMPTNGSTASDRAGARTAGAIAGSPAAQ